MEALAVKPVIQKKVCLLGAFAVGKTSLCSRFVSGIFSEKYLSTMGVKIDRKSVELAHATVNLMLWDIHGEESNKKVSTTYMRGAAAYLLVIDGTRIASIEAAREVHQRIQSEVGEVPFVALLNKCDLKDEWQCTAEHLESMRADGWEYYITSARTGENVDAAFTRLAEQLLP